MTKTKRTSKPRKSGASRPETIKMTLAERDWLHAERKRAISEAPINHTILANGSKVAPAGGYGTLEVAGRDRGGQLLAAVYVRGSDESPRYVRRLRGSVALSHGRRDKALTLTAQPRR